jgi:hypothetical protein
MSEAATLIALAGSGLAGLGILAYAALTGWRGWLDLKRLELAAAQRTPERGPAMDRIEMADLKERIRKLESIASCVDI